MELEPWPRVFLRNLADLFRPSPRQLRLSTAPGTYWSDALVNRPVAWSAMGQSSFLHALALALIFGLNYLWLNQPHVLSDDLNRSHSLEHYELTEYLPPVNSTPNEKPRPPVRREAQKADPVYAPQEIVTIHPNANSIRQTIVNPVNPEMLQQERPLPNIVAWNPVPGPAPAAANHPLKQVVPEFTPEVAPPAEDTMRRNLNALQLPGAAPQVVEPATVPASRNLSAVNLPAEQQAAVAPSENVARRTLGEINMGLSNPTVEAPKLTVPEQVVVAGGQRSTISKPQSGGGGAPAPPAIAGIGKAGTREIGQLIVLNANPTALRGPVAVPEGSRRGEFTASPTGRAGASGKPEIAAGDDNLPSAGKDGISVPNIFVAAPPRKVTAGIVMTAPAPANPDFSKPADSQKPPGTSEAMIFGDKKFYSMVVNMPNLNSGGGSWILRFAELNPRPGSNGEGVSGPLALTKADPAYPAALVRDRIEGIVVLYAVIHSDGHVGEIRVLEGVHEVLDENARNALLKWRFRPGKRDGVPVDLEAVVKIPFKVPRSAL
ncbi:MAG TPA: energy transducer TonB [Candidatus Saccharimonadales bacterium]|nr:energy transducer TonB [Candidatus Saccharimonadales bacterium]